MRAVILLPWFFPSYTQLDWHWLLLNKFSTKEWQACQNKILISDLYSKKTHTHTHPSFQLCYWKATYCERLRTGNRQLKQSSSEKHQRTHQQGSSSIDWGSGREFLTKPPHPNQEVCLKRSADFSSLGLQPSLQKHEEDEKLRKTNLSWVIWVSMPADGPWCGRMDRWAARDCTCPLACRVTTF